MNYIDFNHDDAPITAKSDFLNQVLSFIEEFRAENKYVPVKTSGSTGTPKIFDVEKEKMQNSAKMTCDFLNLKPGNTALVCLPMEYISGKMMVVRSLERGLKLYISEPKTQPLQELNFNVDFCAMTPLQVENSLDKIHFIKNLIIGGAGVSETLKKKIFQRLAGNNQKPSIRIFETFGMSETLSHIALKEIFPNQDDWFSVFDEVAIGKDERGCLTIFAPQLNSGKLYTNDLVDLKDAKHFKFLGRVDNVINSGGAKIFPEELEANIKKQIDKEVVFFGVPDETLGQKLILIVEGKDNENVKSQISNLRFEKSYHRPKQIVFIEKIPRTPNGKIDRLALKKIIG